MSCPEYKAEIIESARGAKRASVQRHLAACTSCAEFFAEQRLLTETEQLLANEIFAGPEMDPVLLREFDSRRRRRVWAPAIFAIAAALLLAFWLLPKQQPKPAPVAVSHRPEPPAAVIRASAKPPAPKRVKRPARNDDPFIPIPYTVPLAPYERTQVVQVEMPVAELIAVGFPISTSDAGAQAKADVLIGDDGRARAVRLISISERSMER